MSLLSTTDLAIFIEKESNDSEYPYYATIRDAVEKWIENYCGRILSSTALKERYDGTGDSTLVLDNYPVTSIERLAFGTSDAVRIRCTTNTTHAVVSVTQLGVTLRKDGVSDSTAVFSTYTTLSTLVAKINTISGWEASLQSSSYSSYLSSELIKKYGLYCGGSSWAYLEIPDEAEADFDVDANTGMITLNGAIFPEGTNNIFVDYTAGYTNATAPKDLQEAIKIMCKTMITQKDKNSYGLTSYSIGNVSESFGGSGGGGSAQETGSLPPYVSMILDKYKRIKI